jgi:Domain of unknown function (DUF4279)
LADVRHAEFVQTTATFRLFGDGGLTAEAVTSRLGIQPSKSFEAGTPMNPRSPKLRDSSAWLLQSSSEIEAGVELEDQLARLLTILEPHADALWDLVRQGYRANWFCYVASNPAEHAVELNRELLGRLVHLPGDLWLDVCGD